MEDARFAEAMVTPWWDDTYKECGGVHSQVDAMIDFLGRFPDEVVRELFPDGEPGYE